MIPFSGLSRFSGLFDGDGPSPQNRDTTVLTNQVYFMILLISEVRKFVKEHLTHKEKFQTTQHDGIAQMPFHLKHSKTQCVIL